MPEITSKKPQRPFLKWAGNKYQVLRELQESLPKGNRLLEPFVGSGAVFLNASYRSYLLNDANQDLISLYKYIQKDGERFIRFAASLFSVSANCEKVFYERRAEFNEGRSSRRKAALFLYLNRHCYNGLCRYNSKGGFNTPFGRYRAPYFPAEEMKVFFVRSQAAKFVSHSYENVLETAGHGDVVYCDPPYAPLSATANFTSYSRFGFGEKEQLRLVELGQEASKRGATVILSNHSTPFIENAYSIARKVTRFPVRRFISCKGNKRRKVLEILAVL
jgi:DNA adenine methylase